MNLNELPLQFQINTMLSVNYSALVVFMYSFKKHHNIAISIILQRVVYKHKAKHKLSQHF